MAARSSDILVECDVVLRDGRGRGHWPAERLGYTYRHCELPEGAVVVAASSAGMPGDPAVIGPRWTASPPRARRASRCAAAPAARPSRIRPGHKAWALVDSAGCRGLRIGDAQVSEKHCNFLLNLGNATSAPRSRSWARKCAAACTTETNIILEWEIQRIGVE